MIPGTALARLGLNHLPCVERMAARWFAKWFRSRLLTTFTVSLKQPKILCVLKLIPPKTMGERRSAGTSVHEQTLELHQFKCSSLSKLTAGMLPEGKTVPSLPT